MLIPSTPHLLRGGFPSLNPTHRHTKLNASDEMCALNTKIMFCIQISAFSLVRLFIRITGCSAFSRQACRLNPTWAATPLWSWLEGLQCFILPCSLSISTSSKLSRSIIDSYYWRHHPTHLPPGLVHLHLVLSDCFLENHPNRAHSKTYYSFPWTPWYWQRGLHLHQMLLLMQKIALIDVFSNDPTVLALSPSVWLSFGGRDSRCVREQHSFTQLRWDVMIICFLVSASSFCCNCIRSIYSSQWLFTFRVCFRKLTKVAKRDVLYMH